MFIDVLYLIFLGILVSDIVAITIIFIKHICSVKNEEKIEETNKKDIETIVKQINNIVKTINYEIDTRLDTNAGNILNINKDIDYLYTYVKNLHNIEQTNEKIIDNNFNVLRVFINENIKTKTNTKKSKK